MTWFRLALVLLTAVLQATRVAGRFARRDVLDAARCEVRCWSRNEETCIKDCLLREEPRPGYCPTRRSSTSSLAVGSCATKCRSDSHCQGVLKCCKNTCGVDCQPPVEIDMVGGLPDIPEAPRVIEKRKKKIVVIDWANQLPDHPKNILYVVEERHHTGQIFNEKDVGEWRHCSKSVKPRKALKQSVKPGRWYQFRVAAVNENGTKGYSNYSLPFRIFTNPKPPNAPDKVTVEPLVKANGSLSTTIKWTPPPSDLPILKYKVFWSRRIYDSMALDSVLIHQQVVPKDQTHLILRNLQPNCLYFLQVQALVQFGDERLKGEKSGLVLNTTNYMNEDDNALILDINDDKLREIQLLRLAWQKGKLKARVIWKHLGKTSRKYRIKWWNSPCHARKNRKKSIKQTATVKGSQFNIPDLQFDCQYRISIQYIPRGRRKSEEDTFITFTTPKCSVLQKSLKKLKCN